MYRQHELRIITIVGQCSRCEAPLVRRKHSTDATICRACLRVLDADVTAKKQILFPPADTAGEILSAFA